MSVTWSASSPSPSDATRFLSTTDEAIEAYHIQQNHVRQITVKEKIEILKICIDLRVILLSSPTSEILPDKPFWKAVLRDVKARLGEGLAKRWSSSSALKESVNQDTCRKSRRMKARAATPRKNESPEYRRLQRYIQKWNKIWALHEVLVLGPKLCDAVEGVLGAGELEDLIGHELQAETGSGPSLYCVAMCHPEILDAIRRNRDEMIGLSPRGRRSLTEDLSVTPKQLHLPDASSSRAPEGSVILGTTPRPQSPIYSPRPFSDIMGSPESTDSEYPSIETLMRQHKGLSSSSPGRALSQSRPPPETPLDRQRSISNGKGKDVDKGDSASHDDNLHGPSSAGTSVSKRPTEAKSSLPAINRNKIAKPERKRLSAVRECLRQEGSNDGADEGVDDEVEKACTDVAAPTTRQKRSRTPALIRQDNERVARKHAKPLKPVHIPRRVIPSASPGPAWDGPSYPEITPPTFYQAPGDRPAETTGKQAGGDDHGSGSARQPLAEIPPSPLKRQPNAHDIPRTPAPAAENEFKHFTTPTPTPTGRNLAFPEPGGPLPRRRGSINKETLFASPLAAPSAEHSPCHTPAPQPSPTPIESSKWTRIKGSKKRKRTQDEPTPVATPSAPGDSTIPHAGDEIPSPSASRSHKRRRYGGDGGGAAMSNSPALRKGKAAQSSQGSAATQSPALSHSRPRGGTSSPNHRGRSGNKGTGHFHKGQGGSPRMPRQGWRGGRGGGYGNRRNNWTPSRSPLRRQEGSFETSRPPSGPRSDAPSHKWRNTPAHGQQQSQPVHTRFDAPSTPAPAPSATPPSSGLFVRSQTRNGGRSDDGFHEDGDSLESARRTRESTVSTDMFYDLALDKRIQTMRSGFVRFQREHQARERESERRLAKLQTQMDIIEKHHARGR